MRKNRLIPMLLVAGCALASGPTLLAQTTTCKTGNCAVGKDAGGNPNLPAECVNIATPRTIVVQMESNTLRFIPSNIRIEGRGSGGLWAHQCIVWHKTGATNVPWHSATEVTGGSSCNSSTLCTSTNTTPPCEFETGNIDNSGAAALEFSVCHYRDVSPANYPFQCRQHFLSGMAGSLQVVQEIQLLLNKNVATDEVRLAWFPGGVGPWNAFKDNTGPMPTPTNLTPAGTVARAFGDMTLRDGNDAFYLVMERN